MLDASKPFHAGELEAQRRAGVGDVASRSGAFIRDHMPEQHREFYTAQPFLIAASSDADGRIWTTVIEGEDRFIQSPDPQTLTLSTQIDPHDPLARTLFDGADIGVIGIELATRRRNRLSGTTRQTNGGLAIDIRQTFGNCPQYISERDWWRVERTAAPGAATSDHLDPDQITRIHAADTLFIGSGQHGSKATASSGFDASHRGGEAGFVRVIGPSRLQIPDYAGNNFFNTIGNLLQNPRIGLLFVDFATGGLLHITGRAEIDWAPQGVEDPGALRMIDVTIDAVIDRPGALSLRWTEQPTPSTSLVVTKKVAEAEGITSFYLASEAGVDLAPFKAGQHLSIALQIPGQANKIRRTYSLSGRTGEDTYRLTVKRDPKGTASRFLHDNAQVGDVIEARPPTGDFMIPDTTSPLVLVSAGVGLTPMLSMLHQAVAEQGDRPVWFVHGARNGYHHALRDEVDHLIRTGQRAVRQIYYSAPEEKDLIGQDYDFEGRITLDELLALNAGEDAVYMLCGPAGFVNDLSAGLEAAGVPAEQIHFETFG